MNDDPLRRNTLLVTTCDTDEALEAASGLFTQYRHHYGMRPSADERPLDWLTEMVRSDMLTVYTASVGPAAGAISYDGPCGDPVMGKLLSTGLALALGLSCGVSQSWAQITRERDVTITGPRGRSIERRIQTERGPGFVDRQVNIRRPNGTYQSDVRLQRGPANFGRGFVPGRGGFVSGGWDDRPVFVNREVVVPNEGVPLLPALAVGGGLFGLGMLTGSALSSAPPPPPAYIMAPAPPPVVYYNAPQPYSPAPPATVVVDPVANAMGRLKSHHDHSRRDGAAVLGRLRDPRAVPALVDRLKNDWAKEVRVAAATALGEIGDPRALVPLERATVYDKRQEVRDAAASSLSRIQQAQTQAAATPASAPSSFSTPAPTGTTVPNLDAPERVPPPPTPALRSR